MDKNKLLIYLVVLMFLIFTVDRVGSAFYWYYTIWWFDILLHFWGGFWVGLFFTYIFSPKEMSSGRIFKIALWILLVGILWEIFEFWANNVIGKIPFSSFDTVSDLCFDLAGGLSAIFFYIKRSTFVPQNTV